MQQIYQENTKCYLLKFVYLYISLFVYLRLPLNVLTDMPKEEFIGAGAG